MLIDIRLDQNSIKSINLELNSNSVESVEGAKISIKTQTNPNSSAILFGS